MFGMKLASLAAKVFSMDDELEMKVLGKLTFDLSGSHDALCLHLT